MPPEVKVHPKHAMEPCPPPPGNTQYPLHRRLVGPQNLFGHMQNILPPHGSILQAVRHTVMHHTDYNIPDAY